MRYDARAMLGLMLLASSSVAISRSLEGEGTGTNVGTAVATRLGGTRPSIVPLHQQNRTLLTRGEWLQMGDDFVGYSDGADYGNSVSMSRNGKRVAISGWRSGTRVHFVQVYEWDQESNTWKQVGIDIVDTDGIGSSMALSRNGMRLIVGADHLTGPRDDGPGHAYVYQWDGSVWNQMGPTLQGATDESFFGTSVSMSDDGNRVAVGASKAGRVEAFKWNGSEWVRMGGPILGESANSELGTGLNMAGDGNRIAVGATGWYDPVKMDSGRVLVFEWKDSFWQQIGNDLGHGPKVEYGLGWGVAMSRNGDRVAMGLAESEIKNGERTGIVRVYELMGSSWVQMGNDLAVDGAAGEDRYGRSMSLSDDGQRLVIGEQTLGFAGSGQAHVFEWNGSTWELMIELEGRIAQDQFGGDRWGVSMSGAGDRIVVGADFGAPENCDGPTGDCRRGYAQAFQFHPSTGPFPDYFSEVTCIYSSCLEEVLETFNRQASYTMFRTPELRRYASSFRTKIHQATWFVRNGGQILKSLARLEQAMKFIEFLEEKKPLLSNMVGFTGSTCATQFLRNTIRAFDGEGILSANYLYRMRRNQLAVARNLRTNKEWKKCVKKCKGAMWLMTNELGETNVPVCLN